jgi:flavin-dependent dehydrogenase
LDTYLVERALDAGAILRQGTAVQALERHPFHVVVRSDGDVVEGRTLVAADGANGQTAKMAGVRVKLHPRIALEGNVSPPNGIPRKWGEVLGLDVGAMEGGYGWIFPKADHFNIGVVGWKYEGPTLRERMGRLVQYYGYDPADVWGLKGHHLPVRQRGSALANGNVLLVGDAAGLVDPFSDEGIYSAIWSGRAAAHHLVDYVAGRVADLDGYRREVEGELAPDLLVSRQFHDLFHLSPALYLWLERRTSILWRLTCQILRGEQTYSGAKRNHPLIATAIDFVSDLVRVTPVLRGIAGLRDVPPTERFFRRRGRPAHAEFGQGSESSDR